MKTLTLSVLCALSAAGCASSSGPSGTSTWRIVPDAKPALPAHQSADAAYRAGRQHHASLRYDRAMAAYRAALQLDPGHARARNALGILLSMLGRHAEAVRELAAAAALTPHEASVRNNLGYALLLRGAAAEAVKELEMAKQLDPGNPRVARNLSLARTRIEGARPSDSAGSPPAQRVARATPLPAAASPQAAEPARQGSIIRLAPQVYELRAPPSAIETRVLPPLVLPSVGHSLPAASVAASPAANRLAAMRVTHVHGGAGVRVARAAPSTAPKQIRLEVSNGNGLNGFARRIAEALGRLGWTRTRLTNQLPFRQPVTEVQYREGYAAEASRLAASLRKDVLVIRNDSLAGHVDVRLVLGRDAWTVDAVVRPAPKGVDGPRVVAARPAR